MGLFAAVACLLMMSTSVLSGVPREKMFFLQRVDGEDNDIMLVVTWSGGDNEMNAGCEAFRDQKLIQEVLKSSKDNTIRQTTEDEFQNVLKDCTEFSLRKRRRKRQVGLSSLEERRGWRFWKDDSTTPIPQLNSSRSDVGGGNGNRRGGSGRRIESSDNIAANDSLNTTPIPRQGSETTTEVPSTTEGYNGWPVIFIGTKWCGAGNIAKDYDDLGHSEDTDRCCRAHDLCNDTLAPGHSKNNLTNDSLFTKLSCKCDDEFYDCLDRVDGVTANSIGNLYFNVLRRECYDFDYPPTSACKKHRSFLKLSCEEYEKNTTTSKVYQWIPARKYKRIPVPGPLSVTLPF